MTESRPRGRPPKERLIARLCADPDLARADRIAIAYAMTADQFSIEDIARVTSVRRQVIIGLRSQTGLPPRPKQKSGANSNRVLEPVVDALAEAGEGGLYIACGRLGIHWVTGWGIMRAILHSTAIDQGAPVRMRCPGCEQVTFTHPCATCGTTWLGDDGAAA